MRTNREISNSFNKQAYEYERVAKVQCEIGTRLVERLDYLKIKPQYVLDLGCGPGTFSAQLKARYPKAHVVGVDIAYQMLQCSLTKQTWRRKYSVVNADMVSLPFVDGQFDLIFSNQVIHWSSKPHSLFRELNRVLRAGGCLMFSTLGPDTFLELRQAFKKADNYAHVNDFLDMHDIGDYLLKENFLDPVVDMEHLTALYPSTPKLLSTLKAQGVRNIHQARNKGLTGKVSWRAFEKEMEIFCTKEGKFPLTYEVIYGHAWKGMPRQVGPEGEAYFPIDQLKKR